MVTCSCLCAVVICRKATEGEQEGQWICVNDSVPNIVALDPKFL